MKVRFVSASEPGVGNRALAGIAGALDFAERDEVEAFTAELRRRGLQVGMHAPVVLVECGRCGASRVVDGNQLGWVLFCDVCGERFADDGNPWTRCVTSRVDRRPMAPFDQRDGCFRRAELDVRVALDGGPQRGVPSSASQGLYTVAAPGEMLSLVLSNAGDVPLPSGYLTVERDSEFHGPRPLLEPGGSHVIRYPVPSEAAPVLVELAKPGGRRHLLARIRIAPLPAVTWRLEDCEARDFVPMTARPDCYPRNSGFAVEVKFGGVRPTPRFAVGRLRLPDMTWPLRLRTGDTPSADATHVWSTALDVVVPVRAEFEVELEYADLIGLIRLRGTIHGFGSVERPTTETSPAPPATPPRAPGATSVGADGTARLMGWGVPLVVDASTTGPVAALADGQGRLLIPPSGVESLGAAADVLQLTSAERLLFGAAALADALERGKLSGLASVVEPAGSSEGAAAGSIGRDAAYRVELFRGVLARLGQVRPGRPDQIAPIAASSAEPGELEALRVAVAAASRGARVYQELDRGAALALHGLRADFGRIAARREVVDVLVVDVELGRTTVSVHRLRGQSSSSDGRGGVAVMRRLTRAVGAGLLDVLDVIGEAVVEGALLDDARLDLDPDSVDLAPADDVWLFSPERRQSWLEQATQIAGFDSATTLPEPVPEGPDDPLGDGGPAPTLLITGLRGCREVALRLLALCVVRGLEEAEKVALGAFDGAEALVGAMREVYELDGIAELPATAELLARGVFDGSGVERVYRRSARALFAAMRPAIDQFAPRARGVGEQHVFVHAPPRLAEAVMAEITQSPLGERASLRILPDVDAPALHGAKLYFEAARLGALDVALELRRACQRVTVAVDCVAPQRQTLIPLDSPVSCAIGYLSVTHPACILTFRPWYTDEADAERIPCSLDTLTYRGGVHFHDLLGRRDGALALKVRVVAEASTGRAKVVCSVVELVGGTPSAAMAALADARRAISLGERVDEAPLLPDGMREVTLTVHSIELPSYPGHAPVAPVELSGSTLG